MWLSNILEFRLFKYVIVSMIWVEQHQCLIKKDIYVHCFYEILRLVSNPTNLKSRRFTEKNNRLLTKKKSWVCFIFKSPYGKEVYLYILCGISHKMLLRQLALLYKYKCEIHKINVKLQYSKYIFVFIYTMQQKKKNLIPLHYCHK